MAAIIPNRTNETNSSGSICDSWLVFTTVIRAVDYLPWTKRWQFDFSFIEAMKNEFVLGLKTIESGETLVGAARFTKGAGRHGSFGDQ